MKFSPVQVRPEHLLLAKEMALKANGMFLYAWIGEAIQEKAERQEKESANETKLQ